MDSPSRGRVTFKLATALQQWSLTETVRLSCNSRPPKLTLQIY